MISSPQGLELETSPRTFRMSPALAYSLFLVPLLFHYFFLNRYAVNVPFMDDYGAILEFMNRFTMAGFAEKIDLLFSQHLEHRIAFSRLFFIFDYYVFGELDMKRIILMGNTGLIVTAWAVYRILPDDKNRNFLFLPIPFFLIQSQHYESAYWAMACIQNLYVAGFAVLTLINLAGETKKSFSLALVFGSLALFTSGNGIFLFPCGVLLLVLKKQWNYRLAGWIVFSVVLLGLYFRNYVQMEFDLTLRQKLSMFPDRLLGSLLGGIGSAFNFEKHHDTFDKSFGFLIAIVMGIFFLILLFEQIRSGMMFKKPVFFSLQILFVLSLAAACVSRFQFGEDYTSVASRYKINSLMIFILLYLTFIPEIRSQYIGKVIVGVTILAVFYNILSFEKNKQAIKAHRNTLLRTSWLLYQKNSFDAIAHYDPKSVVPMLEESKKLGIYAIPDLSAYYDEIAKSVPVQIEPPSQPTNNVSAAVEILIDPIGGYYTIENGWAFVPNMNSSGSKIYIVLKAATKTLVFKTEAQKRIDVTAQFGSTDDGEFNYDDSGFGFFINKSDIDPLKYQVGVLIVTRDGSSNYVLTENWIDNSEKTDSNKSDLKLPRNETKDIQFGFNMIASKDKFEIENGWAVVEGASSEGARIYLVLKSEYDTLVFETRAQRRPDVTAYFRGQEPDVQKREALNFDESGFNFLIGNKKLEKELFNIGLMIVDAKGVQHYILTDRTVNNTGGKVKKSKLPPLSNQRDISLPQAGNEIEHAFDVVENADHIFVESGWAFIKGLDTNDQVIYFVLSGERRRYIFETSSMTRADVTSYFSKKYPGVNLDKSGFSFNVRRKELETGTYSLGIAISKGSRLVFSNTEKVLEVK